MNVSGNEKIQRLTEYGNLLVANGFKVWLTPTTNSGYLQYEKDGFWGTLQEEYFEGFRHLMPIPPSRENGSSMFIGDPVEDVWSVEAAEQCARSHNWNDVIGRQPNASRSVRGYRPSATAVALHERKED